MRKGFDGFPSSGSPTTASAARIFSGKKERDCCITSFVPSFTATPLALTRSCTLGRMIPFSSSLVPFMSISENLRPLATATSSSISATAAATFRDCAVTLGSPCSASPLSAGRAGSSACRGASSARWPDLGSIASRVNSLPHAFSARPRTACGSILPSFLAKSLRSASRPTIPCSLAAWRSASATMAFGPSLPWNSNLFFEPASTICRAARPGWPLSWMVVRYAEISSFAVLM